MMVSKVSEYMAPYIGGGQAEENPTNARRFGDKVKVNRFGSSSQGGGAFSGGSSNTQSQADGIGRSLSNFKVGG